MTAGILALNIGSSSIKLALFDAATPVPCRLRDAE